MQLKLNIELPPEMSQALQRFAEEKGWTIETATMATIAGWLTAHGYLKLPDELDGNTLKEANA
ncbi:MAG TPA: hypothetical protein VGN97_22490 [Mesorhizobium sp.]|jgi:hypothetical protein|nr:hypothetical protein [Mesorhizobium sp.]